MAYHFRLTRKSGYLHPRVTGDNTEETVMGYLRDVLEACKKHDCPNILIGVTGEMAGGAGHGNTRTIGGIVVALEGSFVIAVEVNGIGQADRQ